jgi:hypothetical protein
LAVAAVAGWLSSACSSNDEGAEPEVGGSSSAPAGPAPFLFVDATEVSGLSAFHQVNGAAAKPMILESIGAGLGLIDYDRDGDLDAYFTNGSTFETAGKPEGAADALFENDGKGKFRDVTASAGLGDRAWTSGVRVVDYDGDGWSDLYLTNYGPNVLYRNLGNGRFEDVTQAAGVGDPRWSTGACFLDFDHDGDLDLYVANYVDFDPAKVTALGRSNRYRGISVYDGPRGLDAAADRFYRNVGGNRFEDVSEEVGVAGEARFGFQTVVFDLDQDGWLDLYVANDSQGNFMWRNLEGRGFEDVALRTGLALGMNGEPQAGMGVALGDYDGDQALDLYVTNFSEDYFTLYRCERNSFFRDVTRRQNLRAPTLAYGGWGCGFEDFDSDGDLDLYAVNGHVYPQVDEIELGTSYRQRDLIFENDGKGGLREPVGRGGPGFALEKVGRGSAVGDLDGDGDLDILVGNLDDTPTFLRNDSPQGNAIFVRLESDRGEADVIGARVTIEFEGGRRVRWAGTSSGFLSSDDARLHFGLGAADRVETLEVQWAGGGTDRAADIPANQRLTLRRGQGVVARESF